MKIYLKQNVFDAAIDRTRWLFDQFQNIIVGFSGGKDSTVALNIALKVAEEKGRLPVRVLFIDQEAEWKTNIDYVRSVMNDPRVDPAWLQIPMRISNATSQDEPWLKCWEPGKQWMRPKEPNAITENVYGTQAFYDLFTAFMRVHYPDQPCCLIGGVRAGESPTRLRALTSVATWRGRTWGAVRDAKRRHVTMHPLYDWTETDIWKAIHANRWAYCTPAETPIWMGDYSFKRIEDVRAGDTVIGFTDPEGERSALVRTRVVATHSHIEDVVKITLDSGRTIRCTADHRWVRNPNSLNGNWRYGPAEVGDHLAFVIEPFESSPITTEGRGLAAFTMVKDARQRLRKAALTTRKCASASKKF